MFSYQARLLSAAANNGSATGVRGKLDDVKKVKGVNIFPPAIEETLTHEEVQENAAEARGRFVSLLGGILAKLA